MNASQTASAHTVTTPAHASAPRGWPVAAVAALIAVLIFEAGVWKGRYHLWDANYILLEQKRRVMTSHRPADDVAILGSSRFYHLRPDEISAALDGARVTNYAWGYCGVEAYESMLRGLINAGRAPKTVLVDGMPEIFAYKPELLSASRGEGLRAGLAATAPKWAAIQTELNLHAWDTAWEIAAQAMTPPGTLYRDAVEENARDLLKTGHLRPLPADYDRMVGSWKRQGWFYFAPPDRVAGEADFVQLEQHTGPWKLRDNKDVAYAYERFLRLAMRHDIQVVLLPVPNNQVAFDAFTRLGVYPKYDAWLDKLQKKYPNFRAPGPRWYCWPGLLGDSLHVNATGADKHMEQVLSLIK